MSSVNTQQLLTIAGTITYICSLIITNTHMGKIIMNKLIALITALTLSGCASPYSKFYTNRFDVDDPINSKQVIITQGEPKVIHSSNTDEKIVQMLCGLIVKL